MLKNKLFVSLLTCILLTVHTANNPMIKKILSKTNLKKVTSFASHYYTNLTDNEPIKIITVQTEQLIEDNQINMHHLSQLSKLLAKHINKKVPVLVIHETKRSIKEILEYEKRRINPPDLLYQPVLRSARTSGYIRRSSDLVNAYAISMGHNNTIVEALQQYDMQVSGITSFDTIIQTEKETDQPDLSVLLKQIQKAWKNGEIPIICATTIMHKGETFSHITNQTLAYYLAYEMVDYTILTEEDFSFLKTHPFSHCGQKVLQYVDYETNYIERFKPTKCEINPVEKNENKDPHYCVACSKKKETDTITLCNKCWAEDKAEQQEKPKGFNFSFLDDDWI